MISDAKLEKLHKALGPKTGELDAQSPEQLKATILECEKQSKQLTDELEADESFQAAKEVLKDLRAGIAPVKRELAATTQYCLHNLEQKGQ